MAIHPPNSIMRIDEEGGYDSEVNSRPNIVLDARMLGHSGIGTYVSDLLESVAVVNSGFRFQVIAPRRELLPSRMSEACTWVKGTSPIYGLREQLEINRLAKTADLLHCPHYNAPYFFRGPMVVTIHDLTHLMFPQFLPNRAAFVYARLVMRAAVAHSRLIITNSEYSKRCICQRYRIPECKIRVIYLILSHRFLSGRRKADPVRLKELGIVKPYILYVGVLKRHKNVEGLIRALSLVDAAKRRGIQLVIAGRKDRAYQDLDTLTRDLGLAETVVFTGQVRDDDLHWLYAGAMALALVSLNEGFGLPALEGMAYGLPVVAANNSSLPEVVGDAGILVDPHDSKSIASALEELVGDERARSDLGRLGQERVKLFSPERFAEAHLAAYREALAGS
ncbi:MAG: glycosyltransferase family 4 protein [Acidobacteriia bacterium]|nr:glycosyltransferase family 4 protein [Terriglobia bacterium]